MSFSKVNKTTGELTPISGGILYADAPIGSIIPFGGSTIPSGFLLCDGSEVLKTNYSELYSIIGDSFGTASDNTKFVLPDLRGEFLRGVGTNSHSGQGSGGAIGEHQDSSIVNEAYVNPDGTTWGGSHITNHLQDTIVSKTIRAAGTGSGTSTTANAAQYTIRPTNTSVNFIIKAVNVSLPLDFQQAIDEVQQDVDAITPTVLVQTLTAGSTSLTFTDPSITDNSRIIITTDPYTQGAIANAVQSGTIATITFNAQSSDIRVALEIRN